MRKNVMLATLGLTVLLAGCGATTATKPTGTAKPTETDKPFVNAPAKLLGTYYPSFADSLPRLKDLDPHYNLVYLFAATNVKDAPAGTLEFKPVADDKGAWTNWKSDLQYARKIQKRQMMLSVGGAGNAINFTDRAVSTAFVNSVEKIYDDWGGFDGIDFNTFEGEAAPNTPEMIWAAKELKRLHPGFVISAPPAPWNKIDRQFCKDMLDAGALDYCAPQYYDGPDLADPAYIKQYINIWMELMGPEHVVIGFGVNPDLKNYWTLDTALAAFTEVKSRYPSVKGVFDWRLDWDAAQDYPFAKQFDSLVSK